MLAIERRNMILSKLSADGKVIVSDLSREFSVTEETIRRDLEKLDNDGLVKKTYGGAVKVDDLHVDAPFNVRKVSNVEPKQEIAAKIAEFIEDGDYLMLDASSTALYLVKNIINKQRITIITNSVEILLELANKSDWNVFSTGGSLKPGSLSLVGRQAESMISSFHVDMAICSCKGIDIDFGITDSNEKDSEIKQAFFKAAKKKILVADDTKFDKISFSKVCDLGDVDMVVTNSEPSEQWRRQAREKGIQIIF